MNTLMAKKLELMPLKLLDGVSRENYHIGSSLIAGTQIGETRASSRSEEESISVESKTKELQEFQNSEHFDYS